MLERMGLSVVGEADTVEAAGLAARELRPQAALVDVALPDGNGLALAVELAGLPWKPRIVLTSNDAGAVTDAIARSAGAIAFIAKHELPRSRVGALLAGSERRE
jgi:DNA-binding NarL/FixJ family response regulator